jgi:phosphatidylserine/phosphatidylglycerophosphate/cardiolipin synthase-like enzyme
MNFLLSSFLFIFLFFSIDARSHDIVFATAPIDNEVCFSPDGPCDLKLVKFIQSAKKNLVVAIYDLTHPQLAHEIMVAAKKIPVRVLVDKRQSKGKHSLVSLLVKGGVDVRFGYQRGIMHNKFTVVDGNRLETGSYNYTNHATESNNENQIYLFNPAIAEKYAKRFEDIWEKGQPYQASVARG